MKTAIILDLDGTILNTLDDLCDSVNAALEKNGFPLRTIDEVRNFVGNGAKNLIIRSLGDNANDENIEKTLSDFKAHYETNKTNKTAPYDGMLEALDKLHASGCKLAIVSNKHDDAVQGLYKQFFSDTCDFALGNCDFLPKKPAPDMILYALEKIGKTAEDAVYIGDSEVDVTTAKNTGIPCISVSWGFRDRDVLKAAGAEIIVDTSDELLTAIKNL
ncbi:MAG: HAD family hydrolase [Oscillospiraceae bacterium]|nr:HAD family hydrolase [Oscillospiraceae bacterium]